jgi:hypothetical protein
MPDPLQRLLGHPGDCRIGHFERLSAGVAELRRYPLLQQGKSKPKVSISLLRLRWRSCL